MGNRFEVGEIAIVVPLGGPGVVHPGLERYYGQECEITDPLGSFVNKQGPQYGIRFKDGQECWILERGLRKRPQPGDYKSTLIPCDKQFPAQLDRWLNPITEPVVREGLKGILQPFGFEGAV